MTTQIIIQARLGSSRLPRKVLCEVAREVSMLEMVVQRVQRSTESDGFLIATTGESVDDELVDYCRSNHWPIYRGSERDVLSRYAGAAESVKATSVVRITSDCPLIDPQLIDRLIRVHRLSGANYASNVVERSYPRGQDIEVVDLASLEFAAQVASQEFEREHVTPYINRRPNLFKLYHDRADNDHSHLRWTVDTQADLDMIRSLISKMGCLDFGWQEAVKICQEFPEIPRINQEIIQKSLRAA